jgi:hypothetical protein
MSFGVALWWLLLSLFSFVSLPHVASLFYYHASRRNQTSVLLLARLLLA